MEVVGNVSSSIHTIHSTLSKIMTFKDEWFTLSDDYQLQVEILSSTLLTYQEQFRLHKQPTHSTAMRILKKAEDSLRKVDERLDGFKRFTNGDQCCSLFRLWYAKLNIALFPENIEKTVTNVEKDIDNIVKVLKGKTELVVQLQEERKRKAISKMAHSNNGSLYVPIEKPQSAVIKAINNSQGHQVILLYGGAGKGKSTLAKWTYFTYGEARENENGEETETENPFERLPILVSCAKCSKDDISAKQFEILQEHAPDILGDIKVKDKGSPDSRIAEALRDFLSVKKFLLILDDVTNVEFLHGMWDSTSGDGRDVKYLVTSQDAYICDVLGDLEPERIPMEKPTPDEARKILGSLVGLGPIIPDELQLTADKIIQAVEVNPLALACVASQFKHTANKKEIRVWSEAYKGLDKILKSKEEKFVLGSAPRSLGAAIESCINNLESPEARKILFFMCACKGETVHEAILRIWHARIEASSCPFFMLKDELVMKELLKPAVNLKEKDPHDAESTAWSLGPLAELFIKHWVDEKGKRYEKDMWSTIGELIGEPVSDGESAPKSSGNQSKEACEAKGMEISEKARVTIVLCALYFDQSHIDVYEIVTKAMTRANIPYSNDKFNDLKRQAIEPMVWLLDKQEDEGESWKGDDVCCVQKVLLAYLCDGQLDGKNICHLLKLKACPAAQLATLKAISDICLTDERLLFNEHSPNFLQAILHLMNSNEGPPPTSVQKTASRTLRAVCWKGGQDRPTFLLVDSPGILDVLVRTLARPSHWATGAVASALANLARYSSDAWKLKFIRKEGALGSLIKCLFEHSKPDLQRSAAGALTNLALTEDNSIKSRIFNQAGALDGLVKLLFVDDQPEAQKGAAVALENLADAEANLPERAALTIAKKEGALAGIQKCLSAQGHPALQHQAARLLLKLAECEEANAILKGTKGLAQSLSSLLVDGIILPTPLYLGAVTTQDFGARALTLIDPTLGKEARLTSEDAYDGRYWAFIFMGMYAEALVDLDIRVDLRQRAPLTLSKRCFVRAKLEDFKGALDDANEAVTLVDDSDRPLCLQERGVLKQIMGDLQGALADLDEGLELETDDYERLKHRGYVKFLLKDEEGARADAEWALRIKPTRVDSPAYGRYACLGTTSVEYLGYKLK